MSDLADRARAELPAGTRVEYKRLSVAVHYRNAPPPRPRVEQWGKERASELGLRLQAGRMVLELKPPGQRDKGSVLREETEGHSCAWYFGDDVADLRAFDALTAREEADPDFVGVRVAVANAESGHALIQAADIHSTPPRTSRPSCAPCSPKLPPDPTPARTITPRRSSRMGGRVPDDDRASTQSHSLRRRSGAGGWRTSAAPAGSRRGGSSGQCTSQK